MKKHNKITIKKSVLVVMATLSAVATASIGICVKDFFIKNNNNYIAVTDDELTTELSSDTSNSELSDNTIYTDRDSTGVLGETIEKDTLNLGANDEYDYSFAYQEKVDGYDYYIRVNRAANCVTIYGLDDSGFYSVPLRAMICSTGEATPLGVYTTSDMYTWRMLEGDVFGQYAIRIHGSIMFHSVPYYTPNKNDIEYEEYNKLGKKASLGCIRLKVEDEKWIYDNCPAGTTVDIYDDAEHPGPLGKPSAMKINLGCGWDPTDPDENNPWKHYVASLTGVSDHTVERGDLTFNVMDGVKAMDMYGNDVSECISINGNVDLYTPGTYELVYTASDGTGNNISYISEVTVIDTIAPVITSYPVNKLVTSLTGEVTDDFLREGMTVTDADIEMDPSDIILTYEPIHEGFNDISYTITDIAGNTTEYSQSIFVDTVAPQIILNEDKNIPEDIEVVDEAYARSRVLDVIEENGIDSDGVIITIKKIKKSVYHITYSCTDFYGNESIVTEELVRP